MAATSDSVNRALGMVAARAATTAAPRLLSLSATPRSRPCASTRRRGRAPPRRWFASPFCSWRPPSTTSRSATPSARRRRGNPGATNTRRSIMRLASRRKTCRTIWRGSCTTRRSATVGPKVSTPRSAPRVRARRARARVFRSFSLRRRTLAAHRLLRRRVPALRQARRVLRRPVVLLHDPGLRDLQPSTPRHDRPQPVAQMRADQVLRTLRAVLPH
mmetsp:Transcript_16442/g.53589  ORF Transcript_16442/g.53589 Transcript_16442/m.53589 type:complete len:217 (-) Transcript_16442:334-984(-)